MTSSWRRCPGKNVVLEKICVTFCEPWLHQEQVTNKGFCMSTRYTNLAMSVAAIFLVTLWMILPKGNLLGAGIDTAGGTKLVYEIKPLPGGELTAGLAEQVMEKLKKRVDPDGVRKLIWRLEGNNRLEIQVPASPQSAAVGEVKRLLKGSGVLEFHLLVEGLDLTSPDVTAMRDRLKPGGKGPAMQAGDDMRWYQVERPEDFQRNLIHMYNDEAWALAWIAPAKQMVNGPGIDRWALESAFPERTELGVNAVGFRFDAQGAKYFGELTGNNLKRLLAVMLDGKIMSAATIQSRITKVGIISRESGYSDSELRYLLNTLNAGSLPAQLSDEPISDEAVEPGR